MARPLCYQPNNQWCTFEITFRCQQARFLMHPGDEACRRMLGVLGRSLQLYGKWVLLHFAGGTSNHLHLIVSTWTAAARADFKCHLKTNLSKELGDLHDWKEHLFGRRSRDIVILDDEALRQRFRYLAAHGIKEGLVSRKQGWPGIPWIRAVTEGKELIGNWYNRTELYRLRKKWSAQPWWSRGREPNLNDVLERISVPLTPPPTMEHLDEEQRRAEWKTIFNEAMECYPEPHDTPLGTEAVLNQHPHTRPKSSKKSPAPNAHATDGEKRAAWRVAYKLFADAYRQAWTSLAKVLADPEKGAGMWSFITFPSEGIPPARLYLLNPSSS